MRSRRWAVGVSTLRKSELMASAIETSVSQQALAAIVRRIRYRWRLKLLLRGMAVVSGATVLGLLLAPWLMEQFRFHPAAVVRANTPSI